MKRVVIVALAALWVGGCAPEVVRRPTQLAAATDPSGAIEILQDTPVSVGPGYRRVISRGSTWARIGRIGEGEVYKPIGGVLTVEGAQVHEAYLVLDGDRVVGFYLPVERAFAPAPDGGVTRLPFQRR